MKVLNLFLMFVLPISAQGLPAGCVAEWRAVFGKNSCCEEKCTPLIISDADGVLQICLQYDIPTLIHSTKSRGKTLHFAFPGPSNLTRINGRRNPFLIHRLIEKNS
jgi:hypothetical protein